MIEISRVNTWKMK